MAQYYTVPTTIGQAKLANAVALGVPIEIVEMAVGDGGGSTPDPDSSRTALINEVRRAQINASETDPDNPSWIVIEQVIPPDIGGWTIREVGVFDADGDMIAYGNYPETYKPVLSEGSGRTQTIRFVMQVSDTAAVTLKVDPSIVLATRGYVDDSLDAHEKSRNHPAATTTAKGLVELATSAETKTGSDSQRAVTPAGNKAALDAHRGEADAHAADRISLGALAKLGNPSTVQAALAALGSAAVRDEGAGNGLDADKLDGQQGSYYRNANNLNAGTVPAARLSGSYDISVSGTAANASQLGGQPGSYYRNANNLNSGTVSKARLSGSYDIDISGNASKLDNLQASQFLRADARNDVLRLTNREVDIDPIDGGVIFDASHGLFVYIDNTNPAGWYNLLTSATITAGAGIKVSGGRGKDAKTTIEVAQGAGSGLDADKLDGQQGSYYRNANNLNAGTVPKARLSGSYDIDISGNAATATNASKLGGQAGSYYRNASNLNAGTVPAARLPDSAKVTTSSVLNATKGANVGAVGTYALLNNKSNTILQPGDTIGGSNLEYTSLRPVDKGLSGKSPSGTWRCMGHTYDENASYAEERATLFLRIS